MGHCKTWASAAILRDEPPGSEFSWVVVPADPWPFRTQMHLKALFTVFTDPGVPFCTANVTFQQRRNGGDWNDLVTIPNVQPYVFVQIQVFSSTPGFWEFRCEYDYEDGPWYTVNIIEAFVPAGALLKRPVTALGPTRSLVAAGMDTAGVAEARGLSVEAEARESLTVGAVGVIRDVTAGAVVESAPPEPLGEEAGFGPEASVETRETFARTGSLEVEATRDASVFSEGQTRSVEAVAFSRSGTSGITAGESK